MPVKRHDPHSLSGVYAVDALDDEAARERFARHLQGCQACAGEVRGLREVATALAYAAAEDPPPLLREHVMAAVARTRQQPPVAARARPGRRWLAAPPGTGWTAWMPRLAVATAAVAVVTAVVLGIALSSAEQRLSQAQADGRAIAGVLAAPDARSVAGPATAGGTATVVLSPGKGEVVVSTSGLRPPPPGKVYELWLIGPRVTRRAGLLPPAVGGQTAPVLASGLVAGDKFAMTVEPAGGTSQPTTKPIVLLALPT